MFDFFHLFFNDNAKILCYLFMLKGLTSFMFKVQSILLLKTAYKSVAILQL